MIYVVLGMHKSGTTLVARTLHQSGIYMGQDFQPNADYERSKYEAKWAQDINNTILGIDRSMFSLNVTSALLCRALNQNDIQARIVSHVSAMESLHENWGFKDPCSSLTYNRWKECLPEHRVIVVFRDPVEVWTRYASVNRRWYTREAFKVWADYNRKILSTTADIGDSNILYIRFEDFLTTNEEFEKLSAFTESPLSDVRDTRQSRFRLRGDQGRSIKYLLLKKFAGNDVHKIYEELVDRRNA